MDACTDVLVMPVSRCFREDVLDLEAECYPDAWSERECSRHFKEGGKCLIAAVKGIVVGHMFYAYNRRDMACMVSRLYVTQGYRRKGIGTAMLARLQKWYRKPWRSLDVIAWEGDLDLQLFLRRHGFQCFGVSDGWYDDAPEDQVYWFSLKDCAQETVV